LVDLLRLGAAVSCGFFNVLIVHPANPAKTVADVLAQARAKPGELTHSSGGIGTSHHMSGVLLELRTGVKLQHVPRFGQLERGWYIQVNGDPSNSEALNLSRPAGASEMIFIGYRQRPTLL
jgi:Tripartite tricarboxylate transporter family receptor